MSYSWMTPEEQLKFSGNLHPDTAREMVEKTVNLPDISTLKSVMDEARGMYVSEDFLEEIISRLSDFSKRLRGENKKDLTRIIALVEDIQYQSFQEGEYGRDILSRLFD